MQLRAESPFGGKRGLRCPNPMRAAVQLRLGPKSDTVHNGFVLGLKLGRMVMYVKTFAFYVR